MLAVNRAIEPKLDGWRAIVTIDGGLRVRTRLERDVIASVPELAPLS
jgi:ATP-dependent DNA ligase